MNGGRYNRLSQDARRALSYDNAFLWQVARQIGHSRHESNGGRPNEHPLWVFFLWMILTHEYGSCRKVEEALEDIEHGPWRRIRDAAFRELSNDRPDLLPPAKPPTRNQFNYALKHHLPANSEAIAKSLRRRSRKLAAAMNLGHDNSPGSLSRPRPERVAYGDVTVMTPRTRRLAKDARHVDMETGEIFYHRHDEDAAQHTTGGGAVVPGLPWAFTHLRGPERNRQVILAVDPVVPGGRSEGHLVVDQYLEAAAYLPGLVGYAYDRALRGIHLDRLLKAGHLGLVGVYRMDGKKPDRFHGFETFHPAHGQSREVEIHLVGGAPHIRTFDVDGNQILNRLVLRRINRRDNKREGSVRLSAEYGVVDRDGQTDGYLRLRLDQTAADGLKGYNRPEHLRAFPEDSNIFVEVQRPLRGSAESANRSIDDNLPRERLHHFGFEKNQLSMLAWQVYRNAQTEAIFAPGLVDDAEEQPRLKAAS